MRTHDVATLMAWLFWILVVGGAIVLPAGMLWQRRRCLADPRFAKTAGGERAFAGQIVDAADRQRLMGWQRRMIAVFVVGMAFLAVFAIVGLLGVVDEEAPPAIFVVPLLVLVAVAGYTQFSATCPRCRYRLGLQSRLLLPPSCERCGVTLREEGGEPTGLAG